ncbi:hypothetical protein TrVFT333_007456 [Trichoderma virens FT-333]|nr:hypothetical protein TrVFT333_007456 [Trichoderma virens FT-333]
MLPFWASARVDSLLALASAPEYMKDYDMTNSTLVRFIEDQNDSPDINIWEMAGNGQDHFFVWSFRLPKENFQTSPDGRVALSGKFVAGGDEFNCTREFVSKRVDMLKARTEEQFYNGRAHIKVLEDSREMKAWHVTVHERFNFAVEMQVDLTHYPNPI